MTLGQRNSTQSPQFIDVEAQEDSDDDFLDFSEEDLSDEVVDAADGSAEPVSSMSFLFYFISTNSCGGRTTSNRGIRQTASASKCSQG